MRGTKARPVAPRHRAPRHRGPRRRAGRSGRPATLLVVVTAAAAALVATGGGGASGSQGGTADPGVRVVTARQTSTVSALAPGSEAQPLRGTFDNRSAEPVYVTAVRARVAAVEGAAGDGDGACTVDDYRIAGTGSVGGRVAPGEGRGTRDVGPPDDPARRHRSEPGRLPGRAAGDRVHRPLSAAGRRYSWRSTISERGSMSSTSPVVSTSPTG
jgi:hypothetical protein